jgi:hypothetical protein
VGFLINLSKIMEKIESADILLEALVGSLLLCTRV